MYYRASARGKCCRTLDTVHGPAEVLPQLEGAKEAHLQAENNTLKRQGAKEGVDDNVRTEQEEADWVLGDDAVTSCYPATLERWDVSSQRQLIGQ